MDLSKAFQAGAGKHLPKAAQCFDAFHLVKLANEALDEVRREEVEREDELSEVGCGEVRTVSFEEAKDGKLDKP